MALRLSRIRSTRSFMATLGHRLSACRGFCTACVGNTMHARATTPRSAGRASTFWPAAGPDARRWYAIRSSLTGVAIVAMTVPSCTLRSCRPIRTSGRLRLRPGVCTLHRSTLCPVSSGIGRAGALTAIDAGRPIPGASSGRLHSLRTLRRFDSREGRASGSLAQARSAPHALCPVCRTTGTRSCGLASRPIRTLGSRGLATCSFSTGARQTIRSGATVCGATSSISPPSFSRLKGEGSLGIYPLGARK